MENSGRPIPWIALGALHRDLRYAMQSEFAHKQLTVCIIQAIPKRVTAYAVTGDSKLLLDNLALDHDFVNVEPDMFPWSGLFFPGGEWDRLLALFARERVTLVILRPFG